MGLSFRLSAVFLFALASQWTTVFMCCSSALGNKYPTLSPVVWWPVLNPGPRLFKSRGFRGIFFSPRAALHVSYGHLFLCREVAGSQPSLNYLNFSPSALYAEISQRFWYLSRILHWLSTLMSFFSLSIFIPLTVLLMIQTVDTSSYCIIRFYYSVIEVCYIK